MASGSSTRRSTRSASNSDKTDVLAYHTRDVLDQLKVEVAKVCSVNEGTEKKIARLIEYLDEAPTEAIKNRLMELNEDMKDGFTLMQTKLDGLNNQIGSSMQEWQRYWEMKFDESIELKLHSIQGILSSILTTLPTRDNDDPIQVQTTDSDIHSRSWALGSVEDFEFEGQPHCMWTLADSLEQAVGTASVTRLDKAVGTADITWEEKAVGTVITWGGKEKAVGTASITSEWRRVSSSVVPHIDILRRLVAEYAECLLSAVAERLPKVGAVAECLPKVGAVVEHLLQRGWDVSVVFVVIFAIIVIYALMCHLFTTNTLQDDVF